MIRPHALTDPATVHAWAAARMTPAAAAVFALDATLGAIARTTTTPIVGQMRLTWWHDALIALDAAAPPAHPVLRDLAGAHVSGATLAAMIDAWEIVIDPDRPDVAALERYADARGGTLFRMLAQSAGDPVDPRVEQAGRGWALVDLAAGVGDPAIRAAAAALAATQLADAFATRWPASMRIWGAPAVDAGRALDGVGQAGSPRRALAVLRFRLTGR